MGQKTTDTELGGTGRGFPATHWSIVAVLRDRDDPAWRERINALAQLYWKPIYRHIRIGWKKSNEDAKDLTQAFFLHMLEGKFLEQVSQSKGRFRTFVKACLENFLKQARRDANRFKRGGGKDVLSIDWSDEGQIDVASPEGTPEESIDREWRRALLQEAVGRLREAYAAEHRSKYFEVFRIYDLEGDGEAVTYKSIAGKLNMKEADVDNHLSHARKRLFEIVREIVAESVADETALTAEMKELFPGH